MMWQKLQQRIDERQSQSLLRQRLTVDSPQSVLVKADGQSLLNFSSNDYLGLANHPKMIEAIKDASKTFGVGSGASHLVAGHSHHHHALEQELAEFLGTESALLFSSGFMANYGVLSSLFDGGDLILQDKLNHASLIDGGLASKAKMVRFTHADMDSLQRQLQTEKAQQAQTKLVVTDGVFSMDGDVAPLPEMINLCTENHAQLMVDDAHGFGVLGKAGKGSLEFYNLPQNNADIFMATFGKALGGYGAFVAGKKLLIESLIQFARSYIYTTAIPPALAAANRMGLKLIQTEPERRQKLKDNIQYFRQLAKSAGLPLMQSPSAIQPLLFNDNELVLTLSQKLKSQGILVVAIRPPTVPEGSARLRVALSSEHSYSQIEQLIDVLSQAVKSLKNS